MKSEMVRPDYKPTFLQYINHFLFGEHTWIMSWKNLNSKDPNHPEEMYDTCAICEAENFHS